MGFIHPMLDSLGIAQPLREVVVAGRRVDGVVLSIPSPARLRSAICRQAAFSDSGGLIVGFVRGASDGAAIANVAVMGEWLEYALRKGGMNRHVQRLVATTGENGFYAMCNVPKEGVMTLRASRGADSTARLEIQTSSDGFARRDLYLGASHDGRVSGVVLTTADGRAIAGARVGIADGPQTRTNERGEFTIGEVAAGTRVLEVRALGYYPERRPVDVVAGAPTIRIAMMTMKAVLDTIRVTAVAITRGMLGFEERARSGPGRYITSEQLERRRPNSAEQVFQNLPGLKIGGGTNGRTLMMRSLFVGDFMKGDVETHCGPAIFIDGMRIPGEGYDSSMRQRPVLLDDIDSWIPPDKIAGIEIYQAGQVPAEFAESMSGCGAVVIWRKR